MNVCNTSLFNRNSCLMGLAILIFAAPGHAETFEYKVVYSAVPGIEEIEAGNHDAAIALLESRARAGNSHYMVDELSTLCALYIVKRKLSAASVTCNHAVETDGSDAAYNNRGVLLAQLGKADGALQDFKRARVLPGDLQSYVNERMKTDARVIASSNFGVAARYTAKKRDSLSRSLADRVHGAKIEDLEN